MIETVGYTDDGDVWLTFRFMLEGREVKATMTLDPENAMHASTSLAEAAKMALTRRTHVGERPDINQNGA